ncbi:MAG TPA: ATP-binding protein [Sedimentisphaerales bacterium]|nr:ATP-binding protein [Sedimentisphaerales bacterium]HNU28092.1 ATP-binding protein [Sedimentisphaerales bacterium]
MRRQRGIIWAATAMAVASLVTATVLRLQGAGAPAGAGSAALHLAIYCAGAVGVIVLGIGYCRLAGAVTSMAAHWKADSAFPSGHVPPAFRAMALAIEDRLADRDRAVQQLRNELKDIEIRSQLAERQLQHTEAILYSLRDAVIVMDGTDRLLMANGPAARLFGFDPQTARHRPVAETMGAAQGEFVDLLLQSRRSRTEATKRELQFVYEGRPHIYDTILSCVQTEGKVSGVVAVLHDITREKEVSQMKNDFVSHVSHELKTPLASITAYSEMLADGEADDEETRKEFYSVIQSQAQRLNRLIEDILNISRIESGLIKVNKERASLTILIEEQMQMIRSYAEEKNITVTGGQPIVYDQVLVDKDMICQVIVNLLSNAVKYTPAGGRVTIGTEVNEASGFVRVSVTDTGVGIPADEVGRVFDKFYRVAANNKQAKGTGLGLNLVKQIVEKVHGGRVFVTSQVGVGSTFGFDLPLATARQAALV